MGKQNFHKILCWILLCSSVLWFILLAPTFTDFAGTDPFRSALQTTHQISLLTDGYASTEVINRQSADKDRAVLLSASQQLGSGSNEFKGIKHENSIAEDCNGRYVYMYKLPAKFNDLLLRECRELSGWTNMCPHIANSGLGQPLLQQGLLGGPEAAGSSWFDTNQFTAEVIFHERMKRYRCLTPHPSKATAFYVPFYAGFDMSRHVRDHNLTARDRAGIELVQFLRSKPQWKKRGGRDHFMVIGRIARDFMRGQDSPRAWGNKFLLHPEIMNMSSLLIEAQPRDKNQHGIPYPSYFHPRNRSEIDRWQKRMRSKRRQILFSFAGAPRPRLERASIRGQILEQCSSSPRCELLRCQKGLSICNEPSEVMRLFSDSVFCLQPQGDSFTRRSIFDSMLAGCIPVFFTEHSAYTQYKWHLPRNRSSYSVYIPEKSVQRSGNRSIEQHLQSLSADQVESMRREVIGLIPSLTYADPRHSNVDFTDSFDLTLQGLVNKISQGEDENSPVQPSTNSRGHGSNVRRKSRLVLT